MTAKLLAILGLAQVLLVHAAYYPPGCGPWPAGVPEIVNGVKRPPYQCGTGPKWPPEPPGLFIQLSILQLYQTRLRATWLIDHSSAAITIIITSTSISTVQLPPKTVTETTEAPPKTRTVTETEELPPKTRTIIETETLPPQTKTVIETETLPPKTKTLTETEQLPPKTRTLTETETETLPAKTLTETGTLPAKTAYVSHMFVDIRS